MAIGLKNCLKAYDLGLLLPNTFSSTLFSVKPDVVIWIQGRATTPEHRVYIRELIGAAYRWPKGVTALVLFFVGYVEDDKTQYLLEYESEHYNDIIQNDYKGRLAQYSALTL